MKDRPHIHNLDTLEKEIYRQQLLLRDSAKQLEKDLDYFRENFIKLARNSIKKERNKEEKTSSFFEHMFKNEHVREAVTNITDRITDHAAEAVNQLIDSLFHKHK